MNVFKKLLIIVITSIVMCGCHSEMTLGYSINEPSLPEMIPWWK